MSDPKLELWLVRHGETTWNAEGRWQGQTDVPMSKLGREQAHRLAARLEGTPFESVISSDLERALETARIVSAGLETSGEIQTDPRWREIDVGALGGLTAAEAELRGLGRWHRPFEERYPNGESRAEMGIRVARALAQIAQDHTGGRVIVFSHGGAIKSAFGALLGDPKSAMLAAFGSLSNTAISRFTVSLETVDNADEGEADSVVRGRLLSFNDTAHLEAKFVPSPEPEKVF